MVGPSKLSCNAVGILGKILLEMCGMSGMKDKYIIKIIQL